MLDALAALTKTVLYAGVLTGAGTVFANVTLRTDAATTRYLARAADRGAWLTIFANLVAVLILIFRLGDFDLPTLSAVFMSGTGASFSLQVIGAASLLAVLRFTSSVTAQTLQPVCAALITSSFIFNGHAAAASVGAGLIAFMHVSLAAWWVGSLLLLKFGCTHLPLVELAEFVRRFSRQAVGLVIALVVAGAALIYVLVDFNHTPQLPYGKILAAKLALVVVVLALAAHNKFRLTARVLRADANASASLNKTVNAELIAIGAIAAATAILTTYASPHG